MKNMFKYIYSIRNAIIIMFGINSISMYKGSPGMVLLLGGISVFLIINDYARYYRFYKNEKKTIASTIAAMAVSIVALILGGGYMTYYYFVIIGDILDLPKIWARVLMYFHASIFAVMVFYGEFIRYGSSVSDIFTWNIILKHGPDLLFSGFMYAACLISFYSYSQMIEEKHKTNRLNKELNESNKQLKEYTERVEELTISKERNRVAQELHDSLGHSLTALIMYLDFIEKIIDSDKERAIELVIKAQSMARDSMNVLRKAVYALKEDKHIRDLNDSISELIDNITSVEGINVTYKSNGNIEDMSPGLKNIVYRTIQEGITNGLKHGKASEFNIYINMNDNGIRFIVENNGLSCREPAKGNGLLGIEERVYVLNGSIQYLNNRDKGFGFDITIPIEKVAS